MRISVFLFAAAAVVSSLVQAAGDEARGKTLYETRCMICHTINENRIGPMHKGLFGRKAGSVPGFDYSQPVKDSKLVWDEKNVEQWLAFPDNVIPGQKMGFYVPDAQERADIIAYLKQQLANKPPEIPGY